MEYREADRKITLTWEFGKRCIIVHRKSFDKWDDGSKLASEKREEVLAILKAATEFEGLRLLVR